MGNFINGVLNKKLSRREFLAASAAGAASLALSGCGGNNLAAVGPDVQAAAAEKK